MAPNRPSADVPTSFGHTVNTFQLKGHVAEGEGFEPPGLAAPAVFKLGRMKSALCRRGPDEFDLQKRASVHGLGRALAVGRDGVSEGVRRSVGGCHLTQ